MADPELRRDDNEETMVGMASIRPSRVMQRIVVRLNYCFPKPPSGILTSRGVVGCHNFISSRVVPVSRARAVCAHAATG
jgi:hypothetical protein